MRKLCVITNGYPTKDDPSYAFVRPLIREFADDGVECTVIAPQSYTKSLIRSKKRRPFHWVDKSEKGNDISIYQPRYFSFSNLKCCGFSISYLFRKRAIRNVVKKYNIKPDAFYAHFWDSGIIAASICENVPVFVATGESCIWVNDKFPSKYINVVLKKIKGVIAVSQKNLEESKNSNLLIYNPATVVIPNAFNPAEFYCKNKVECRDKLGYGKDDFIIAFVGAFCERKGTNRLVEAIKKIKKVKVILIGSGDDIPKSDQIVFMGRVPHDRIVDYLNAADVFVLPTLAEGCCNAIVEAMACGLPVISSNCNFNDDILDDSCSIRINPNSVEEISKAIQCLYENDFLRQKLADGSLAKVASQTIEKRAKNILMFMDNYLGNT